MVPITTSTNCNEIVRQCTAPWQAAQCSNMWVRRTILKNPDSNSKTDIFPFVNLFPCNYSSLSRKKSLVIVIKTYSTIPLKRCRLLAPTKCHSRSLFQRWTLARLVAQSQQRLRTISSSPQIQHCYSREYFFCSEFGSFLSNKRIFCWR